MADETQNRDIFSDPKFFARPEPNQINILSHLDPKFKSLPPGVQKTIVRNRYSEFQKKSKATGAEEENSWWNNPVTRATGKFVQGMFSEPPKPAGQAPINVEATAKANEEFTRAHAGETPGVDYTPVEPPKPQAAAQPVAAHTLGPFDTRLTAVEEKQFQTWKKRYAPKDSGEDYDLRGAFKAGLKPDAKTGHWPDTFKKPNHPSFSDESQYYKFAPEKAGKWIGPNHDQFVPPGTASTLPKESKQKPADLWSQILSSRFAKDSQKTVKIGDTLKPPKPLSAEKQALVDAAAAPFVELPGGPKPATPLKPTKVLQQLFPNVVPDPTQEQVADFIWGNIAPEEVSEKMGFPNYFSVESDLRAKGYPAPEYVHNALVALPATVSTAVSWYSPAMDALQAASFGTGAAFKAVGKTQKVTAGLFEDARGLEQAFNEAHAGAIAADKAGNMAERASQLEREKALAQSVNEAYEKAFASVPKYHKARKFAAAVTALNAGIGAPMTFERVAKGVKDLHEGKKTDAALDFMAAIGMAILSGRGFLEAAKLLPPNFHGLPPRIDLTPSGLRPQDSPTEAGIRLGLPEYGVEPKEGAQGPPGPSTRQPAPSGATPDGKEAPAEKPYEFSSTQLELPKPVADKVLGLSKQIDDADLAGKGREDRPHVTVKFGLHEDDPSAVEGLLQYQGPIELTLGKTGFFPPSEGSEGNDVVYVEVDSPQLHALNGRLSEWLPNTDTHPEYKPHITLAYVKPGTGVHYAEDTSLEGQKVTVNELTFSGAGGKETTIKLGGAEAPATTESGKAPTPGATPLAPPPPASSSGNVISARLDLERGNAVTIAAAQVRMPEDGPFKGMTLGEVLRKTGAESSPKNSVIKQKIISELKKLESGNKPAPPPASKPHVMTERRKSERPAGQPALDLETRHEVQTLTKLIPGLSWDDAVQATMDAREKRKTEKPVLRDKDKPKGGAVQPPAPAAATPDAKLPADLAGSSPRYGYRDNLFGLEFENDVDKALYTIAQKKPNKAHDKFMDFLRGVFPGESDGQLKERGNEVKARIKAMAATADPSEGPLTVPGAGPKASETPSEPPKPLSTETSFPSIPPKPAGSPTFSADLYRGEGSTPEEIYGKEAVEEGRAYPVLGKGTYYSFNEKHAKYFGEVSKARVELNNPLVIDSDAKWSDLIKAAGTPHLSSVSKEFYTESKRVPEMAEKMQAYLKSRGYDGVIVKIPEKDDTNERGERTKRLGETFGHSQVVKFGEAAPAAPPEPSAVLHTETPTLAGIQPDPTGHRVVTDPTAFISSLAAGAPPPGGTLAMPTSALTLAPEEMQFRSDEGLLSRKIARGPINTWEPNFAGAVDVWFDPSASKVKVVNGHHRTENALRLGIDSMNVHFIEAASVKDARSWGALKNIAEGTADAFDAAVFFRERGGTLDELAKSGLSMKGSVARDGMALAQLSDEIFERVRKGDTTVRTGVAIGEAFGTDHALQRGLAELVERQEKKGRRLTSEEISALAERSVKGRGETVSTTKNLFGEEEVKESNAVEAAELEVAIRKRLGADKRLFGFLARESRAEALKRGGNVVNVDKNKEIAESSKNVLSVFETLLYKTGPVEDAIREGAARIARGEDENAVRENVYNRIFEELQKTIAGGKASPGAVGPEVAGRGPETPPAGRGLFVEQPTAPANGGGKPPDVAVRGENAGGPGTGDVVPPERGVAEKPAAGGPASAGGLVPENQPVAGPVDPPKYGDANRAWKKDQLAERRARIAASINKPKIGIDPQLLADVAWMAGYHLEAGVRTFGAWSEKMEAEFGDWIKPHLDRLWSFVSHRLATSEALSKVKPATIHVPLDQRPPLREASEWSLSLDEANIESTAPAPKVKVSEENAKKLVYFGQKELTELALSALTNPDVERPGFVLAASTGTGKCLAPGTPVLMFNGQVKRVEEVAVGDLIMGPDSKPRKVLGLGHGVGKMYEIVPNKGNPYKVNAPHILSLKMTTRSPKHWGYDGKIINMSVTDLIAKSKHFRHCAKTYRVGVEFQATLVPVDPYFLGLWLGDGTESRTSITSQDKEIIDFVSDYAKTLGLKVKKYNEKPGCAEYGIVGEHGGRSLDRFGRFTHDRLQGKLFDLSLLLNKHIPNLYKANSRDVRMQVLAGLVDSDGSLTCGGYEIMQKRLRLAMDICFLARSLGFAAYWKPCVKTCVNNGKKGVYYRVFISGDVSKIPVRVERKKALPRKQKKDVLVTGFKIKDAGIGEYFGFELDGDGLFLLGDFTVTHNTYMGSAILSELKPKAGLILTTNQGLIDKTIKVGSEFGLDIQRLPPAKRGIPPEGLYIATYSGAIGYPGLDSHPWNMVMADESDSGRRWWTSQSGILLRKLSGKADRTLFMSATPFHTPVELGYADNLGVWKKNEFDKWVSQFGVYQDENGNWIAPANPKRFAKLRLQMTDAGVFINLTPNLDGYTASFGVVPLTSEQRGDVVNIKKAFDAAILYFTNKRRTQMVRAAKAGRVVYTKAYLERVRLPQAIELAKQGRAKGWSIGIFTETRSGRDEIYDFLNEADQATHGRIKALLPPLPGVIETLRDAFGGDLANFSGSYSELRQSELEAFNKGEKPVIASTYAAGGRGVDMNDTSGVRPRLAIYLGPPWSGVMFDQAMGRFWRFGTKSDVFAVFLTSDARAEFQLVHGKVIPRLASLRALISGVHDDKFTKSFQNIESALSYSQGGGEAFNPDDFTVKVESNSINHYNRIEIPDATTAHNKGLQIARIDDVKTTGEGFGEGNTVFTKDKAEKHQENITDHMNELKSGVDPSMIHDLLYIGGYYAEGGIREFGKWQAAMVDRFGDSVREYLPDVWDIVNDRLKRQGKKKAAKPKEENAVLPGFGGAVEEQKAAASAETGRKLTDKFNEGPLSIDYSAGKIEGMPLFRGTEAAPQREMFSPAPKPSGVPPEPSAGLHNETPEAEKLLDEAESLRKRAGKIKQATPERAALLNKAKELDVQAQEAMGHRQGPGGKTAGPPEVAGTPLEQLTQATKAVGKAARVKQPNTTVPLPPEIKENTPPSKTLSAISDLVTGAWKLYSAPPASGDFHDALGVFQGHLQRNTAALYDYVKEMSKQFPDKSRREAMTNWVQADGDNDTLLRWASLSKGKVRKAYQAAMTLTDEEKTEARNVRNMLDSYWELGHEAGILNGFIENYVPQIRKPASKYTSRVLAEIMGGILRTDFKFAKKRTFETYFEGEQAGFPALDKDIGFLVTTYVRALVKAIEGRAMVRNLLDTYADDGRPLATISGVGRVVSDPATGRRANFVNPNIKPEAAADYRAISHPALRQWIWAGKGAQGNPIFLQGDIIVHPSIYKHLRNVLSTSAFRQPDAEWYKRLGATALDVSSFTKQTIMGPFATFHQFQVGLHGLMHRINPFNPPAIDWTNEDQVGLVNGGLVVANPDGAVSFEEGLVAGGIWDQIPWAGTKLRGYKDYLFKEYIPRLKMSMGMAALERNRKTYGGKMSAAQIYRLTANEANAAFGELNNIMLGRNKTVQDALRLVLLAPDFSEARARFVGQAIRPGGQEQLTALALGAVALTVSAYAVSRLLKATMPNTKVEWHPDHPFAVQVGQYEFDMRSLPGDILELAAEPRKFFQSRENPLTAKPADEAWTGKDWRGMPRTFSEKVHDFFYGLVPISMQGMTEEGRHGWQSMLGAFGVRARKYYSPAGRLALEIHGQDLAAKSRRHETPEIMEGRKEVSRLFQSLNSGVPIPVDKIAKLEADGLISGYTAVRLRRAKPGEDPFLNIFASLGIEDKLDVWDKAEDDEREKLRPELTLTRADMRALRAMPPKQRDKVLARYHAAVEKSKAPKPNGIFDRMFAPVPSGAAPPPPASIFAPPQAPRPEA